MVAMRALRGMGRYVPGESLVHGLDPVAKTAVVLVFAVCVFLVDGFAGLAVLALGVAGVVAVARLGPRDAFVGMRAVSILLAFTVLAHALRWRPATEALLRLGPVAVDGDGLIAGAFFASRIALLVVGTSLLTLTTPMIALTDGIERMLGPLARLRLPVHDLAMMLSIALRFIPTTAEEAERIMVAQAARGARFDRGGPLTRAKAYLPVMVPLFVGLFRRADRLALAMEARCYRGGEGRTRMERGVMTGRDVTVALGASAALVVVAALL